MTLLFLFSSQPPPTHTLVSNVTQPNLMDIDPQKKEESMSKRQVKQEKDVRQTCLQSPYVIQQVSTKSVPFLAPLLCTLPHRFTLFHSSLLVLSAVLAMISLPAD